MSLPPSSPLLLSGDGAPPFSQSSVEFHANTGVARRLGSARIGQALALSRFSAAFQSLFSPRVPPLRRAAREKLLIFFCLRFTHHKLNEYLDESEQVSTVYNV